MPPRSVILPERMQKGYRNSQMLKYGFLKVGREATVIACAAGGYDMHMARKHLALETAYLWGRHMNYALVRMCAVAVMIAFTDPQKVTV